MVDLGGPVTAAQIYRVADGAGATLGDAARARVADAQATLERAIAARRRIYGVTTGYGPLASHPVTPEQSATLQRNLVYHLASGVGPPFTDRQVRAIMAARVASLARGHSGIGHELLDLVLNCLNRGVHPVVPCMGTVGASGDLTPLAHVALALMGEGECTLDGHRYPSAVALQVAGLRPVQLGPKEGIALVNGTSAMTGVAALNAVRASRLVRLAFRSAVAHAEVFTGRREAWDPRFGIARPHRGQRLAHQRLQRLIQGSSRLLNYDDLPPRLDESGLADGLLPEGELPQDAYTIRCVPQLFGAVLDVLRFHQETVHTELRSASDNPLVFPDEEALLHGGNFYGQHISFASDALMLAIVKTAVWSERAIARLTDRARNQGLPAFLHGGPAGLNSGFMGAQVTASALVAELRSRAHPASIQSISTNADNQDVVTLGTIAARKASEALDLAWNVLAIQAMTLAQAVELRAGNGSGGAFSASTEELVALVRTAHPPLTTDRPLSPEIARVATLLEGTDWAVLDRAYAPEGAFAAASAAAFAARERATA